MIKHLLAAMFSPDNGGDDTIHVLAKGTVGFIASVVPLVASRLDIIHDYLQVAALGAGLVISILTIVSLSLTVERKIRARIAESKNPNLIIRPDDSLRD